MTIGKIYLNERLLVHMWAWRAFALGASWHTHSDKAETISVYVGPFVAELFLRQASHAND